MRKFQIGIFLLSVFFITFLPVKDTDFGWHYRGSAHNASYFLPNYPSAYPSFLYDTSLALVYDRFGFVGVGALGAVIMTASALVFIFITSTPLWISMLSYYAILLLSWSVFGIGFRP